MDSIQQIYATNQTPLSQTFRASNLKNIIKFLLRSRAKTKVQYGILKYGNVANSWDQHYWLHNNTAQSNHNKGTVYNLLWVR